jgi:cell division protein FtsQ
MSRVKNPRVPMRPTVQDRPSRWQMLLRRQRRMLAPAGAGLALLAVGGAGLATVHVFGQGASFRERLGHVTALLGLRVQEVVITGRQKTPEGLLNAALGIRTGDAILTYSLAEARARVESIQWVQQATVSRQLPGTIVVRLEERRPFAVWQHDGRFVLIDRYGKVVTDSDLGTFAGQLPLVVGAGAPAAAAALLDALAAQPSILARVSAAVRVGERRWNLRLSNGTDVLLPEGAEAQALARLVDLQNAHALLDRPLQAVDMRLPDRLVFRPQTPHGDGTPNFVAPSRKPT